MLPLLLAAAVGAVATASPASTASTGTTTLLRLPEALTEVSGMAYGLSGTLFVHEDSGAAPVVVALTRTGGVRATYDLGVDARDWEDMAAGPAGTLLVADVGDNNGTRTRGVLLHAFSEPTGPGGPVAPTSTRLVYEDSPQDAEALLVHPRTGQVLVITKGVLGSSAYAAPVPLARGVLRKVADVTTRSTGTPGGPVLGAVAQRLVTAGAVSPDGRRLALRTYTDAYVYEVPNDDLVEALAGEPRVLPLPETEQGEAMTWTRDGRALLVTGEGVGVPVSRVPVPPATTGGPAAPDGERSLAAAEDDSEADAPLLPVAAGAGAGLLVLAALLGPRRRRGRNGRNGRNGRDGRGGRGRPGRGHRR